MSVFKKDSLEQRVEKLEKQVKQILQSIGKSEKPEEEVEEEEEYCSVSWCISIRVAVQNDEDSHKKKPSKMETNCRRS